MANRSNESKRGVSVGTIIKGTIPFLASGALAGNTLVSPATASAHSRKTDIWWEPLKDVNGKRQPGPDHTISATLKCDGRRKSTKTYNGHNYKLQRLGACPVGNRVVVEAHSKTNRYDLFNGSMATIKRLGKRPVEVFFWVERTKKQPVEQPNPTNPNPQPQPQPQPQPTPAPVPSNLNSTFSEVLALDANNNGLPTNGTVTAGGKVTLDIGESANTGDQPITNWRVVMSTPYQQLNPEVASLPSNYQTDGVGDYNWSGTQPLTPGPNGTSGTSQDYSITFDVPATDKPGQTLPITEYSYGPNAGNTSTQNITLTVVKP